MKRTVLASAVAILVAFASTEAAAQHRGGGGSRGGGGGSRGGGGGWHGGGSHGGGWHGGGGGHAVPRSGYGHVPGGGAAYARHPRGGTGAYGYGYGHGHGGYYGHGYRPYYGYYRPYYYGGYWPYYGAYYPYYSPWYASFYWGWPYYSGSGFSVGLSYGPVHVSGSYAPAPSYSVGTPERAAPSESRPPEPEGDWGRVRLEVRPDDASVYVDDSFRGTGREARSLRLTPGRHTIELARPGFALERREVEVVEGESVDVLVEMQPATSR